MTKMKTSAVLVVCMAIAVVLAGAVHASAVPQSSSVSTAALHDFGSPDAPPVHGTTTLYRNDDGIAVTVDTQHLRRNSAHTFWFVIFNVPGGCSTPCGADDLFNDAAVPSVVFGGAAVTDDSGRMRVSSGLDAGVAPAAPLRAGRGPGVVFPHLAEVHIIVQDHLGVDADLIHAMLQRPGTGPGGVMDVQSSTHLPEG